MNRTYVFWSDLYRTDPWILLTSSFNKLFTWRREEVAPTSSPFPRKLFNSSIQQMLKILKLHINFNFKTRRTIWIALQIISLCIIHAVGKHKLFSFMVLVVTGCKNMTKERDGHKKVSWMPDDPLRNDERRQETWQWDKLWDNRAQMVDDTGNP